MVSLSQFSAVSVRGLDEDSNLSFSSNSQEITLGKRTAEMVQENSQIKKRKIAKDPGEILGYEFHSHLKQEIPVTAVPLADLISKVELKHKGELLLPDIWNLVCEYVKPSLGEFLKEGKYLKEKIVAMAEEQPYFCSSFKLRYNILITRAWIKELVENPEFEKDPIAFAEKICDGTHLDMYESDARAWIKESIDRISKAAAT